MATAYGDQCDIAGAVASAEGSPVAQQLAPVAATSAAEEAPVANADSEAGDTAANAPAASAQPDAPTVERRRESTCLTVKSGTVS